MRLPTIPEELPQFKGPQSAVSQRDYSNLGAAYAHTAGEISDALETAAQPAAEKAGEEYGRTAVTQDANGNTVVQPAPWYLIGKAGQTFERSALITHAAQLEQQTQEYATSLHNQTMLPTSAGGGGGDPMWFKNKMAAYTQKVAASQPPLFQGQALKTAAAIGQQHFDHLLNTDFQRQGEALKDALDAKRKTIQNQNEVLAIQNHEGPEFAEGLKTEQATWDAAAADPRTGVTQAQADFEKSRMVSKYQALGIVGSVGQPGSYEEKLARAQAIYSDPKLNLSLTERTHLYNLATGELKAQQADLHAEAAQLGKEAQGLVADLKAGREVSDDQIDDLKLRAAAAGVPSIFQSVADAKQARLMHARTVGMSTEEAALVARTGRFPGTGAISGGTTAYSPQRIGDRMEGGYESAVPGPDGKAIVRTIADYRAGRSAYVTGAGNPKFYGNSYIAQSITGRDKTTGELYTIQNVPVEIHDTGPAFQNAPEGRFDLAADRDMSKAETDAQPFSKTSIQYTRRGAPIAAGAGARLSAANWNLNFYNPQDMLPPGRPDVSVDARAATAADRLGAEFFAKTGIRVPINHGGEGALEGNRSGAFPNEPGSPHVAHSQHGAGTAFDFQIQNLTDSQKADFLQTARSLGFTGTGFYEGGPGHLHLDMGRERSWGGIPSWARTAMAQPVNAPPAGGAGAPEEAGLQPGAVAAQSTLQGGPGADTANVIQLGRRPGQAGIARQQAAQTAMERQAAVRDSIMQGGALITDDHASLTGYVAGLKDSLGTHLDDLTKSMDKYAEIKQGELDSLVTISNVPGVATPEQRQKVADLQVRAQSRAAGRQLSTPEYEAALNSQIERNRQAGEDHLATVLAEERDGFAKSLSDKRLKDPYQTAALSGLQVPSVKMPLDMSDPAFAMQGALMRARDAQVIKQAWGTGPTTIFANEGEAAAVTQILANGNPQQVAGIMAAISALPDDMALGSMEKIKGAVNGLTLSGDPQKAQVVFGALTDLDRKNPSLFKASFGDDLQKRMDVWNSLTEYLPPEQAQQKLLGLSDPSKRKARQEMYDAGMDKTKATTAANVTYSLSKGQFFSASPPDSMTPAVDQQTLLNDYRRLHADYFADTGDDSKAADLAITRLGQVWGVSNTGNSKLYETGGEMTTLVTTGRVMKYPPEHYAPQVNGSHDWLQRQLGQDIELALKNSGQPANMWYGGRTLIPDARTEEDINAKRMPSYQVAIVDPTGQHHLLTAADGSTPMRFRPDLNYAKMEATKALRAQPPMEERLPPVDPGLQ